MNMYVCILYGASAVNSNLLWGELAVGARYRVWIVRYEGCQPGAWCDVPAGAIAVEPAEGGTMTVRRARRYVEAFNRTIESSPQKIWAVALQVRIRYVGDAERGRTLTARVLP